MKLSILLFLIGTYGFILNKQNLLLMLISLEIMLLGITLIFFSSSLAFDDLFGLLFGMFIIALAAAEVAIGLSILLAFYIQRESISLEI